MSASPDDSPPDLWVETDDLGIILDWSPAAVTLLGYTQKAAGRSLLIMLLTNRPSVGMLDLALRGHPVQRDAAIRPKDHRAIPVRYRIEVVRESVPARPVLRWTFERR